MHWPSAGDIPAVIVFATEGDLRRMARDCHAADMVVGGDVVARQDLLELVCLLAKNPCGSVAPVAGVGSPCDEDAVRGGPGVARAAGPLASTPPASPSHGHAAECGAHPPLGLSGLGDYEVDPTEDHPGGRLALDDY